MLIEYFDKPPYEERIQKIITKKGDVIEVPIEKAADFPTLAGFAVMIGVARDTILEWSKAKNEDGTLKHPEFSVAYNAARDFQENYLAVNGPKGLINAPFSIFMAKNVIGWRDKQPGEEDKTIINNHPAMDDDKLDERIQELLAKTGAAK